MIEAGLNQQLHELFRDVGEAHHQAFIETDRADLEWPLWYTNFLQGRLNPLLHASFTQSALVYLLILVANDVKPNKSP